MAVQLEFINIIIKRESIDRIVSGCWEGFLQQMELKQFNDCFDDHLSRTGAMSYEEAFDIAHELNDIGLSGLASGDKPQKYWVDFCIFDSTLGTEYRLDWLDSFLREPHLKSLLGCLEAQRMSVQNTRPLHVGQ